MYILCYVIQPSPHVHTYTLNYKLNEIINVNPAYLQPPLVNGFGEISRPALSALLNLLQILLDPLQVRLGLLFLLEKYLAD